MDLEFFLRVNDRIDPLRYFFVSSNLSTSQLLTGENIIAVGYATKNALINDFGQR